MEGERLIPLPERDRVALLRALLVEPTETTATNIAIARRAGLRLDFEDIMDALSRKSDERVAILRTWRPET
jgi:hypothetical protein